MSEQIIKSNKGVEQTILEVWEDLQKADICPDLETTYRNMLAYAANSIPSYGCIFFKARY